MSDSQAPTPMAAVAASADETTVRDQATVSAWGELLQAAHITASDQDLDLRYVAVLEQPGMPDMSHVVGRLEREVYPAEAAERLTTIKKGAIERGISQQGHVELEIDGRTRTFEVTATPKMIAIVKSANATRAADVSGPDGATTRSSAENETTERIPTPDTGLFEEPISPAM